MPTPLTALGIAVAIAALAILGLSRLASRLPHAHPSHRSLHRRPVPRAGGLAIWVAVLPVAFVWAPATGGAAYTWIGAWGAVFAVSLADDFRSVPVAPRLAVHGIAALALALAIVHPDGARDAFAVALAALAIAWGMNLFNFMDGSDGLAAAMAVAGFGAYAAGLASRGEPWIAVGAIAAASLVFLAVNRPPASMFMGDAGAVPLGLAAAGVGTDGIVRGLWPWWFPALAFLPFLLDATVTLARRLLRGERVAEAHRSHYYQRLLQLGFGHGGTLAAYGALMAAGAGAALACLLRAPGAGGYALAVLCAVHAVFFALIDYHWAKQAESR